MIQLAFKLLSRLPLSWLHAIGALFGSLTYLVSPRYRKQTQDNLAQAGFHDPDLARAAAREGGKSLLELPFVWMRPSRDVLALTQTRNWDLIAKAQSEGRGIIFLTPHLGCFEITAQHFATRPDSSTPITVLYRPPRKTFLRPLIEIARARTRLLLAPANLSGVKLLVRALRAKQAVGLLPDQVPSRGEGLFADHFGRPAYTMTLPARLSEMSGAVMLLAYGERLARGRGWIVHIVPFEHTLTGSAAEQAATINRALEELIRRCPAQYLWGYRRYKIPQGVTAPA